MLTYEIVYHSGDPTAVAPATVQVDCEGIEFEQMFVVCLGQNHEGAFVRLFAVHVDQVISMRLLTLCVPPHWQDEYRPGYRFTVVTTTQEGA